MSGQSSSAFGAIIAALGGFFIVVLIVGIILYIL